MKSVLISIKPEWCELIANGKKTVEARKTKPKIKTPFKCYIYCTKSMKHLYKFSENIDCIDIGRYYTTDHNKYSLVPQGYINGKVIGEFVCDAIEGFHYGVQEPEGANSVYDCYMGYSADLYEIDDTCLTKQEIDAYGNKKFLYGWHISDLVIYDEPKRLDSFNRRCLRIKPCENCRYSINDVLPFCEISVGCDRRLRRPPQSWCYVEALR